MILLESLKNIDHFLFQAINQFAFKWFWLDSLGVFLARYFIYFVAAILLLFLFKFRKNWRMVLKAIIAAMVARFVITDFIRLLHPTLRPFVNGDIKLLVDKVNESAFPSGHAAFSFGLATIIYLYNKKAGILFFIAAFLISVARIFVGVHWPSDVLAGAAVGIFSGWLINKVLRD
jgi:undecaprenyl-diphosphatase